MLNIWNFLITGTFCNGLILSPDFRTTILSCSNHHIWMHDHETHAVTSSKNSASKEKFGNFSQDHVEYDAIENMKEFGYDWDNYLKDRDMF